MIGIYIHIPFCMSKCPYCDFYSLRGDDETMEKYTQAVIREIMAFEKSEEVDSVYFGGGTPSVLGSERLCRILSAVKEKFTLVSPEITVECNPSTTSEEFYKALVESGVNRISLGMQSAVDRERSILGRVAGRKEVQKSIEDARKSGIKNISLDLMLGVPFQDSESLLASIMFIKQQDIEHVSAYMLKIEEGTFFHKFQDKLPLPDEDNVCDMYLFLCDYMEKLGYKQYEISNFAKPGYASRHNMKYWKDEEYVSFGPASHSFYNGERYYYERDLQKYITSPEKIYDGKGGTREEYVMLALRLSRGIVLAEYEEKFGEKIPEALLSKAQEYRKLGFLKCTGNSISLTREGFLISNTIIGDLISCLD